MSTTQMRLVRAQEGRGRSAITFPHTGFIIIEVVLLALLAVLALIVRNHPGPLVGDYGGELDLQHWLRPHRTVTEVLDAVSTINWPLPAAITVGVITALLLALRRWLDAIIALLVVGAANGSNYLINQFVHRPRPTGHGIYVAKVVKMSFGFPSGHVLQALVFYGFLVFLTFQLRRPESWLWPLRIIMIAFILATGPSRVLEGEHWPSDVLAALIYGAFWLLLAIQVYFWAGQRWPKLLGHAESAGQAA